MLWIHHDKVVTTTDGQNSGEIGHRVLGHLERLDTVDRIVIEGLLGARAVPAERTDIPTSYFKAWLYGSPVLVMTRGSSLEPGEEVDVWFSPEAQAAWLHYVEKDVSVTPPRRRAKVFDTGEDETPYLILGVRIRQWNASQDLPKPLIGATRDDPDGIAFLNGLGRRRWKPITHALVAEMVKDARRPVPEATSLKRYQIATIGDGQMIRHGTDGPIWIDADAAVHLAGLVGFPLGYPEKISHPLGGEGWSRLSEILSNGNESERRKEIEEQTLKTEDISYQVMFNEIGQAELKRVFPEYRWGRGGRHGERLRDDQTARYARMLYKGHPVIGCTAGGRTELWFSSIAQTKLIEDLNEVHAQTSTVAMPQDEPSDDFAPRPRKRQRKAISRFARALSDMQQEGVSLVIQGGVLKARVKDRKSGREGLMTVFAQAPVVPDID